MAAIESEFIRDFIRGIHIVRFPSDRGSTPPTQNTRPRQRVLCRACGDPLYLTGHFLRKADNHEGPPAGKIVVCISCGWTWWVLA